MDMIDVDRNERKSTKVSRSEQYDPAGSIWTSICDETHRSWIELGPQLDLPWPPKRARSPIVTAAIRNVIALHQRLLAVRCRLPETL